MLLQLNELLILVIEWNPPVNAFSIGPVNFSWYGLMYGIALCACYGLGYLFFLKDGLPLHRLFNLCIMIFVAGFIGARLGQVLFYEPQYFLQNPLEIFKVWKGGMASHGAFIAIVSYWWWYSRQNKGFNFWWGLDKLAIMGALIVCLMRIGNLMNSEIIGKASSSSWAFIFVQRDAVPRHPVVLYEALAYGLYFIIFLSIYLKFPKLKYGWLTAMFLLLLVPSRIFLELFKEDAGYTSLLSIPLVLLGLGIVWLLTKNDYSHTKSI